METRNRSKILGKICPRCGQVGSVLYETVLRIVYECSNGHQYETRKLRRGWVEAEVVIDKQQWLG
jgi:uncharacterized protein (DUF983 family)